MIEPNGEGVSKIDTEAYYCFIKCPMERRWLPSGEYLTRERDGGRFLGGIVLVLTSKL